MDEVSVLTDAKNQSKANELRNMYLQGQNPTQAAQDALTGNPQLTDAQQGQAAAAAPAVPAATAPAGYTPYTPAAPTGVTSALTQARLADINAMYDAQQAARLNELQTAYDINRGNMQATADQIPVTYQTQANANAVDWERQRRNALEQFAQNGLNTGANSQYQLALMGQGNRSMNNIRQAQAAAEAQAARDLANLGVQYQGDVYSAQANADAQRAAALLDEYANGYKRDAEAAAVLAQYGDFSGYEGLYGKDTADGMRNIWYQQNPDVAYVTGKITADQRDNIKHGYPINEGLDENGKRTGAAPWAGGGGGWFAKSTADIMRQQAAEQKARTGDTGMYETHMTQANRF